MPSQSPSTACTSASAATAAVSARMIRGPSASRRDFRLPQQQGALFFGKAAFGADQRVDANSALVMSGFARALQALGMSFRPAPPRRQRSAPSSSALDWGPGPAARLGEPSQS